MSHLDVSGAESSGDSDFVQVEVPHNSMPSAFLEEPEMASVLEKEPESEVSSSGIGQPVPQAGPTEGSSCCSFVDSLHPCVKELIYWRNPVQSGITFGTLISLTLLIQATTVLSVVSLLALCMLIVAFTYRAFCAVVQTFQKRPLENPFQEYLTRPLSLPEDKIAECVCCSARHATCSINEVRRLLSAQNTVDSIKFGFVLYIVYTIASWMSVWTMILIDIVLVFTLPRVYEQYKVPIDHHLKIVHQQCSGFVAKGRTIPVIGQFFPKEKSA